MTRSRWLNVGLGFATVAAAGAVYLTVNGPAQAQTAPRTVKAARANVQSSVSASGNVTATNQVNVSFPTSGRLTEVDVTPGQAVHRGDVLAKVDDTSPQANLAAAQANLASAQAKLTQLQDGLTPQERAQNDAQAAQAGTQVATARTALANAQQTATANANGYQAAVDAAQRQLDADRAATDPQAAAAVAKDEQALASATTAQANGLVKDRQSVDQANGQVQQALAAQAVTLAGNAVKAQPPKPGDLAAAQAAVATAQSQVTTAQKAENDTVLTAPRDGTVATVNGTVGDQAGSGGGSASSSSSSSSGAGGAGGGAGASASTGSSGSSGSSGTAFVTILGDKGVQVKAGFSESDAAKLAMGATATVTFDALPGTRVNGTLASIDPTATVVSNVVTYYAMVTVDSPPDQLKPGMTASVTVTTSERDGVLTVPTAAVQGNGSTGVVLVLRDGQQVATPVQVGLRGDNGVEITGGLDEGADVVIPSAPTGTGGGAAGGAGAAGAGGPGGGRFGGGGLGGLGGGGFAGGGRGG